MSRRGGSNRKWVRVLGYCAAGLCLLVFIGGVFVPFSLASAIPTSRASMAYLCAHAVGGFESFTPPETPSYSDVPTDHPLYAEIEYATSRGLFAGYWDGSFRPGDTVTRDQASVYVARVASGGEAYIPDPPGSPTFPDVPPDHWAYRHIEYLVSLGVPIDYGDGTFHPSYSMDLFEAADWLYYLTGNYVDPNAIPPGGGTIQGVVYDAYSGDPIPGALVTACGMYSDWNQTTTALDGSFAMYGLGLSSDYLVCAQAGGYEHEILSGIPLGPGTLQTLYLGLTMYTPPPPYVTAATMYSPDWHITLNDAGYSDWMIMTYPHQEWHENLSGEWAAAVRYDGIASPGGQAEWLTPEFLYPDFYTGTDFWTYYPIQTWDDPLNPIDGADTGYSEIRNTDLSIAISYTMYMTDTGTAAGLRPGGVGSRTPATSGRYVLGQTYRLSNISEAPITGLSFYQMLHAHPNDDYGADNFGLYDPTAYAAGDMSEFCYDITQYGASMWNPPGSDITGFSASEEPSAWGIGEFPGHGGEPSWGLYHDVANDTLPMATSGGPAEIAGAMKWDLGTLQPGESAEKTVLLWNGYFIPQLPPVGRVLSMPTDQVAVPGTVVEVPVNIGDASGVTGFQIGVTFDPSLLVATGARKGNLVADDAHWQLAGPQISVGSIEVLAYDDSVTGLPEGAGSDSILILQFQVQPGAPFGAYANLHFGPALISDSWGDPLDYLALDGSLRISPLKPNHLYIYPVDTPQVGDAVYPMPFTVAVEARDILGNPLLGYAGSLTMYDDTGTIAPVIVGPMENGYWSGQVAIGAGTPIDHILAVDAEFSDLFVVSNGFQAVGLGDVNADDLVNVLDVVKIVNYSLDRLTPAPGWQAWVADIDHNGSTNILDVLLAVNLSLHRSIYSSTYTRLAAVSRPDKDKAKPVSVSLSTETSKNGTVTTSVVLSETAGVAGLQVDVAYDAASLTLVSADLGSATHAAGGWTVQSKPGDGTVRVLAYNPSLRGLSPGLGTVAVLTFQSGSAKHGGRKPDLTAVLLGDERGGEVPTTTR